MLAKKAKQCNNVEGEYLEPDRDVTTIGDLIYYQYAKIIAKSAFGVPDGSRGQGVREAELQGIGRWARIVGGSGEGHRESSL